MKPTPALVFLLCTAACAGPMSQHGEFSEPSSGAVAVLGPDSGSAAAEGAPGALPPAPQIDSAADVELAQERQLAADSAADAAVLQRLADDSSDDSDDDGVGSGGAKALGDAATWDMDVSTYGRHDRVQHWLDFFEGPARERMGIWLTRLPRYETMIRGTLQDHGLPTDLVYLALIESGYSNSAVSPARATGMWQFMRGTARAYGLRVDSWVDERRDPYKATEAAAQYLSDLYKQFGSLYLAAAAYNAGGGSISRSIRRMPDDDADSIITDATFFRLYDTRLLHRETADYVPKLIAAALIAKQPEQYGFSVPDGLGPVPYDSLIVPGMVGLDVLAKLAHVTVSSVRELNPQYLKLVTPPEGKSMVRLPVGTGEIASAGFAKLPANQRVSFVHYKVRPGESISVIAEHFHISQRELMAANPRVKPRRLQIGQNLIIPTGSGAAALVARRLADSDEPVRAGKEFHTVRRGESVSVIAQRYEVSERNIRSWNHLDRKGTIRIGQRLRIAPSSGRAAGSTKVASSRRTARTRTHVVKRGETLTGLARRYGVSLQALKDANGLHGDDPRIRAGASLRIPVG